MGRRVSHSGTCELADVNLYLQIGGGTTGRQLPLREHAGSAQVVGEHVARRSGIRVRSGMLAIPGHLLHAHVAYPTLFAPQCGLHIWPWPWRYPHRPRPLCLCLHTILFILHTQCDHLSHPASLTRTNTLHLARLESAWA